MEKLGATKQTWVEKSDTTKKHEATKTWDRHMILQ